MKFLSTSMFAKGAGLADAMTSVEGNSSSLFYNPAGMAWQQSSLDLSLGYVTWIADINYNSAAVSFAPSGGRYGVIGASFMYVDYGSFTETILDGSESGYAILGEFAPYAYAFGIGYARALSEQFSVGANMRYAYQFLAEAAVNRTNGELARTDFEASTMTIDFGVFYKTGFESLNFAMVVRNFSPEVDYGPETESSELPLTFKMGLSMDLFDLTNVLNLTEVDRNNHSLLLTIDANRPRDFSEQLMFGVQYGFLNRVFLRGGYAFPNDEQGFSAGIGIKQPLGNFGLEIDYAYTTFGVFSDVNRYSLRFTF
ncbi:MAG: DUF3308 domain-containing protein [Balneolaceae bacterium]|nr:MAG: DUF3308 domain-containing protein [Balneolaceae bacterium]